MPDEVMPGYPEIERLAPSELPAAIVTAIRAAEEAGAARERESCAEVAEGWRGRRLQGHSPDSETDRAFARGVDMAAYYIAAAIRERGKP